MTLLYLLKGYPLAAWEGKGNNLPSFHSCRILLVECIFPIPTEQPGRKNELLLYGMKEETLPDQPRLGQERRS